MMGRVVVVGTQKRIAAPAIVLLYIVVPRNAEAASCIFNEAAHCVCLLLTGPFFLARPNPGTVRRLTPHKQETKRFITKKEETVF